MVVCLQQSDKNRKQAKYFPLFFCPPDVCGLIWSKNQIFISWENQTQLPDNISLKLNYFILQFLL